MATAEVIQSRTPHRRMAIILLISALVIVIAAMIASRFVSPYLKKRAIAMLQEKFHADVEIKDFQISGFPTVRARGSGLILRHEGATDVPPLILIAEFSADASLMGALGKPWKIDQVRLKGLQINIVPGVHKGPRDWSRVRDIPILIHELVSEDAELRIFSRKPGKEPHLFSIRRLDMRSVGLNHAASFSADLTNPTPPGEIHVAGQFGPWNSDEPGQTPLGADFTFANADLGVFKGISGILSSTGKFGGALDEMRVEGQTQTPDFAVTLAGHPILLTTDYHAIVDGMNGNTILHPVIARFLHSSLVANGEVVGVPGVHGRTVSLDVVAKDGRVEDFLKLAVKGNEPAMTGNINFHTKFDLPPGPRDIMDRLKLTGTFGVEQGQFTDSTISGKIKGLSRAGQGKPRDEDAGSGISDLTGKFNLRDGVINFTDLNFSVTGASVILDGSYGLRDEKLDFHGKLRLQAKISQTMTGYKSFLLKPFDGFFRKNNMTELPIKITGTRNDPSFGLDLRHKSQQK